MAVSVEMKLRLGYAVITHGRAPVTHEIPLLLAYHL